MSTVSTETLAVTASSYDKMAKGLAAHLCEFSQGGSAHAHLIKGGRNSQLFIPNGSRLYQLPPEIEERFSQLIDLKDEQAIQYEIMALGLDAPTFINDEAIKQPPLHALSLAIAQKCNMGCSYCYAEQGDFGGSSKKMSLDMAKKSIDLLINNRQKGETVQLTFLGGEPLMNRQGLFDATKYAASLAAARGVKIKFSMTSNGTLIKEGDAEFFELYGFAITISLDGLKEEHNLLRPLKNGRGSYDRIMTNIKPMLDIQKKMQVSARVTVTPDNMNLVQVLDEFIDMGFHSVGFSPLLKSSNGKNEMSKDDLKRLLSGMIACGLKFEQAVLQGKRYPFLNMVNALKEIGKSTHKPYPCGAGAGYMGVSAEGDLTACHRFVNEPKGQMGTVENGIDLALQQTWLEQRHVHKQTPCDTCWARYLCGGGCHHEVIDKGRTACDYIRGWLHFTIQSHERINRLAPNWNK
jgi:uncharacterized protein